MSDETSQSDIQPVATTPSDPWARANYFLDDVELHPAVREARIAFGPAIVNAVRFRDETTIHVVPGQYRNLCNFFRVHEQMAFVALSDITAVDMLKLRTIPRFDVVVMLYSIKNRVRLRIKTGIDDGQPVDSLVPLWPGANWLEREVYDMFGIVFDGHPNLKRILLDENWDEGFPLRKDYPLRGWKEYPSYNTERMVPRTRTRWTGRGV